MGYKILIFIMGVFCFFCAIMDFDGFFEHYKARFIVHIFGRAGARIFYMLFGIFIIFVGLFVR